MLTEEHNSRANFEEQVLPHLDAAYNLARWLTRNDQDAEDVVQEAYLRAFKFFRGFSGGNGRSWLLRIVRNTCFTWLQVNRPLKEGLEFDESLFSPDSRTPNPEEILLQNDYSTLLRTALEELPSIFREVLVLRELEGLSYKEISEVTGTPPGTVMSRLSRARTGLRQCLTDLTNVYPQSSGMCLPVTDNSYHFVFKHQTSNS